MIESRLGNITKKYLLCILLLIVFLPFQNCSQVKFSEIKFNSIDLSNKNNGGGYWGKPDYYRFSAGFTCENKESFVSSLNFTPLQATLIENQKLVCNASQTTLDPKLIDSSIYQNEIIGFQEGIFEGQDSLPTSIPANLVEVWCRDGNDENSIETITHYDRTNQQGVSRIYYARPVTFGNQTTFDYRQISDFSNSRILTSTSIQVTATNGFDLTVHRDQPATQLGLFKGQLKAVIEGVPIERQVSCRVGGSLDAKVWPSEQVIDGSVNLFKPSMDLTSFAYTFSTKTGAQDLVVSNANGQLQKLVSPSPVSVFGVTDFAFSSDFKNIVFNFNPARLDLGLYQVSSENPQTAAVQIGSNFTSAQVRRVKTEIYISNDANWLISPAADDVNIILNSVSQKTGEIIQLSPHQPSVFQLADVYDYNISKTQDRVAYLYGQSSGKQDTDLYISAFDGTNRIKVLGLPDSPNLFLRGGASRIKIPEPGNFIFIDAYANTEIMSFSNSQAYAVFIDDGSVIALPPHTAHVASSRSGFQIVTISLTGEYALFDLQTLKVTPLKDMSEVFISRISNRIFGTLTKTSGEKMASVMDIDGKNSHFICPDIKATKTMMAEYALGSLVIANYLESENSIKIYTQIGNQPCQLRNSLPVSPGFIGLMELTVSPDQQKVLLKTEEPDSTTAVDKLFYIPLNGRPALQVNTPVFAHSIITHAHFLNNSSQILYLGTQMAPSVINGFLWTAP